MIELRNKQYAITIDCVALEPLEEGMVLELVDRGEGVLPGARKATSAAAQAVWGTLIAHWINPRSTAYAYDGREDHTEYTPATSGRIDEIHHIPAGANLIAVGGKGFAEIRVFPESLHESLATLPDFGEILAFSSEDAKLCAATDATALGENIARVVENDGASIAVILGGDFITHPEAD